MEELAGKFHAIPRLLVPIGFNLYRLGTLTAWLQISWHSFTVMKAAVIFNESFHATSMVLWEVLGLSLSFVNMIMWTYNLFIFLLLRVLPQYIDSKSFPMPDVAWK